LGDDGESRHGAANRIAPGEEDQVLARVQLAGPFHAPPEPAAAKVSYLGYAGGIDSAGVTRIAAALNAAVNSGCDEVCLCLTSMGGYVADGIFLYNHIRSLPLKVAMHNSGSVSSIAVAVFLAAAERYCSAHAMFMIHPTVIPSQEGMGAERLQSALNAALADDARTENILRERASIPEGLLIERRTRDIHISPEQATAYGIVHGVREFALPRGEQIVQI
jgi:ATP-dependent protease ClpP protease subunit